MFCRDAGLGSREGEPASCIGRPAEDISHDGNRISHVLVFVPMQVRCQCREAFCMCCRGVVDARVPYRPPGQTRAIWRQVFWPMQSR